MLKEKAGEYYFVQDKSCAEAILLAANEVYHLGMTEEATKLFAGFRTGMGMGGTCGALSGAIGVLSSKYEKKENLKEICADFVAAFEEKLALGTTACAPLAEKYKAEGKRCRDAVELAAEALEEFIDRLEGNLPAVGCTLRPEDIKRVKGMGFLQHKGTDRFNARVITRNGRITAEEACVIAEAARRYGDGYMMLTTRLTVEVSGIAYHNIDAFCAYLAQAGLATGGTGSKVRPVVACKSTTCQYGLYDAYALSDAIHERFYQGYRHVALPHKFKIATGGCPNNCVKPTLNDLGIVGARMPQYHVEDCRSCQKCRLEEACPIHAAKKSADGRLVIDKALCNDCGRCIGKCPFHCNDTGISGYKVYIGGRWGKKIAHGQMLHKLFTQEQEVLDTVEKAILLFRSAGESGERFADTINRIGFAQAEILLLGDTLLQKKAEILGLDVVGGASC